MSERERAYNTSPYSVNELEQLQVVDDFSIVDVWIKAAGGLYEVHAVIMQ